MAELLKKPAVFNHLFAVSGKSPADATVYAEIIVTANYAYKTVRLNSEDGTDNTLIYGNEPVSKIEGYINKRLWWRSLDIVSEHLLLSEIERCKKQMLEEMHRIANAEPEKSFEEKMAGLGFKLTP